MNNFNMNWMFNPPNLFATRTPNRNYAHDTDSRETEQDDSSCYSEAGTAEPEQIPIPPEAVCECGEPGPMGPRGEPAETLFLLPFYFPFELQ